MLTEVAALFVQSTPTPTPSIDPNLVTPGVWGFVAIALIALVVIALVYDMMRRIRRGRYRAQVREELDAEAAAQHQADAAVEASDVDDQDIDPSTGSETGPSAGSGTGPGSGIGPR